MITIRSGKLQIPEEDRFVGFAGDNLSNSKSFVLPSHGSDNGSYTLCLRFDDDSVRVIPLTKSLSGADLVLTWDIHASHLLKAGIVMAQVRSVDSDDVILHSSCDYFIVADSAELSDDSGSEYVPREELEERLTAFLERFRESAPYIGDDDYWYTYDALTDSYVRGVRATASITVDSSMIPGSVNPVQSSAIRSFVESGLDTKVSKTTTVAGLSLSGNITRTDLITNLSGSINPPLVTPNVTLGYGGQYGKTTDGKPVMCMLATTWKELATAEDLNTKMALAPTVSYENLDSVTAGQLFLCQSSVAVKTQASYIELARAANVYSKTDIDSMIGNLENILSSV